MQIGDGASAIRVGYSPKPRDGKWAVVFVGPDGKRREKMTDSEVKRNRKDQVIAPDDEYHTEVARIVARAYAPVYPDARKVTWEEALKALPADLREDTHIAYEKAVNSLLETLKEEKIEPETPGAITPQLAGLFARRWLAGTYTRSKASDATQYKRKPVTLNFYLRQLSAVWAHWQEPSVAIVKENPWASVRKAETDETQKPVPAEELVEEFFAWAKGRYPEWERLHALLELKALSSCRTSDICELRSDQLKGGRVVWAANQIKKRKGRVVLVPDDLFARLKRLAGPTYLWEGVVADLAKWRPSKNRPVTEFCPESLFHIVGNIFKEWNKAHLDKHLAPHDLRRRGLTRGVMGTRDKKYTLDEVAAANDIHPVTARKYYVNAQMAYDTDAFFEKMAGVLVPKSAPTIPPEKQNNGEQSGTTGNTEKVKNTEKIRKKEESQGDLKGPPSD